jgi:exonuclease SbcC
MIPLRVHLKGFLCYKQEQEVAFDGANVWLLAGLNGSGKSTVFDAVTYALFGHHRGGAQDAVELINKASDKASIAFEFALEGRRHLIQRTLQRTKLGGIKATQQIHTVNGSGGWEAVEGTGLQRGFKEWIDQHIGLDYEVFTSSVLLLQGRAEKLLDSTAKGRFEVLAGIVDLERYERLHKRADDERKALDTRVKQGKEKLQNLPEVSALELVAAENQIETAEQARNEARAACDAAQALEFQAKQWAELQQRLNAARQRVAEAEKMLGEATTLERNLERLRELTAWIPRLKEIVQERGRIQTAERELAELHKQRDKAAGEGQQLDARQQKAREQQQVVRAKIQEDEAALDKVAGKLRTLHGQVDRLNELDRQEQHQQRLQAELKRLPTDPEAAVRQAREKVQTLQDLQQALGPLTRLQAQRDELARAVPEEKAAAAALKKAKQHGEGLRAEVDRLKPQAEEAAQGRQASDQQATRDRTLLEQARQQLQDLLETDGAKLCRLCGQALSPSHWKDEKQRRSAAVDGAQAATQTSAEAQKLALERERKLREQVTALESQLVVARESYRTLLAQADQARKDVDRLQRDCALNYQEVPLPFKDRIGAAPADWLKTVYPGADDLTAARQQISTLPARQRALQEATDQLHQWHQLQGQLTTVRLAVERLLQELPRDRANLRQAHASLEAEEKVLQGNLAARRKEAEQLHKQSDTLNTERERLHKHLGQLQSEATRLESSRQHGQQTLERLRRDLPPTWQAQADSAGLAEVQRLSQERDALVAERTEERARQLHEARSGLDFRKREVAELQAQADATPMDSRVSLPEARHRHDAARQAFEACDTELSRARHQRTILEGQYNERQKVQKEVLQLEQDQVHARLLAELLGRDRLQLHLVRQAERQVVDFANAVLDRLSGGQLYLRLAGQAGGEDSSTKALELEAHNRHTGEKPINVAFLSGSQRFRVAVSLALGIGQYASRQHRPLESVIIDEGFGCLDRFGRQLMIQELHNLRGHLRCILVVSHQEEFADAFPDGYRFELTNGTTVATRFPQR